MKRLTAIVPVKFSFLGRMGRLGKNILLCMFLLAALGAGTSVVLASSPPNDQVIFSNFNTGGVHSGPTSSTDFTINSQYRVSYIQNYHYFNKGMQPGTIALRHEDGTTYGPWKAEGSDMGSNVPNSHWIVHPNVELKPGRYKVIDSGLATWSFNAQSKGSGFVEIRGVKITLTSQVGPTSTKPTPAKPSTDSEKPVDNKKPAQTSNAAGITYAGKWVLQKTIKNARDNNPNLKITLNNNSAIIEETKTSEYRRSGNETFFIKWDFNWETPTKEVYIPKFFPAKWKASTNETVSMKMRAKIDKLVFSPPEYKEKPYAAPVFGRDRDTHMGYLVELFWWEDGKGVYGASSSSNADSNFVFMDKDPAKSVSASEMNFVNFMKAPYKPNGMSNYLDQVVKVSTRYTEVYFIYKWQPLGESK